MLKTTKNNGKDQKFFFNAYVEKLQFAFTKLDECKTPQREGQKVNYLLTVFAASEKDQAWNRVIHSPLEQDFGECCLHIAQYLAKTSIYNERGGARRAIALVNQTKFTDVDWHALTPQEKKKVQTLCKKEKSAAGNASSKKKTTKVQHKQNKQKNISESCVLLEASGEVATVFPILDELKPFDKIHKLVSDEPAFALWVSKVL